MWIPAGHLIRLIQKYIATFLSVPSDHTTVPVGPVRCLAQETICSSMLTIRRGTNTRPKTSKSTDEHTTIMVPDGKLKLCRSDRHSDWVLMLTSSSLHRGRLSGKYHLFVHGSFAHIKQNFISGTPSLRSNSKGFSITGWSVNQ